MVNKYALFGGDLYYAESGNCDFVGWFGSIIEAKQYAINHKYDLRTDKTFCGLEVWVHIADAKTMKTVAVCRISANTMGYLDASLKNVPHHEGRAGWCEDAKTLDDEYGTVASFIAESTIPD